MLPACESSPKPDLADQSRVSRGVVHEIAGVRARVVGGQLPGGRRARGVRAVRTNRGCRALEQER